MSAFSKARFVTSAASPADIPPQAGPELAFAGRSNVGKSSAINALARRKRLAFVSRTPGRTRTINFYALGAGALADLPGYGYASAPQTLRAGWDRLIGGYLSSRACLAAVVLLTDARRPLTRIDWEFLAWLAPLETRRVVLLSKADKLTRAECAAALTATRSALANAAVAAQVLPFSVNDAASVDAARGLLESVLARDAGGRK